jgi:hypothetical protein
MRTSAHGIRSLLGVGLAAVASFFVEVADSGPTYTNKRLGFTFLLFRCDKTFFSRMNGLKSYV